MKTNKGLSLLELIISMAISSIVLVMLTQMLSMNLQISTQIKKDNLLFNASTSVTSTIQNNMFDLQAQEAEVIENNDLRTVIHITHVYDVVIDPVSGVLELTDDNPITDILILDKVAKNITYNGDPLLGENYIIDENSVISVVPRDQDACDTNSESVLCEGVLIKLDLEITYQRDLEDIATKIDPKQFVSTIII